MIDLSTATFVGSAATDCEILQMLPTDYKEFLLDVDGCVLFGGGLHIRGACESPDWHSLRQVWIGADALSSLYPSVEPIDIPFAQEACGDQFLLRSGLVTRLNAETGEITALSLTWRDFFDAATAHPIEFLSLQPLVQYSNEGGTMEPGQLLSVYPPYCSAESANGVSLRAISALERIRFLAYFAAQIRGVPDGAKLRMRVK
ncbi:MAG TPA: SMI1/KNR4 family protein [Bryobacteraceae bacterium]|nr:SMI1/KNR4 family protein [Bryobacteraceae bacterium]